MNAFNCMLDSDTQIITRPSWSITECQNVEPTPVRRTTRARRLWCPAKSGIADTAVFQPDQRQKRENGELQMPSGGAFNINWHEAGSWETDNRGNG